MKILYGITKSNFGGAQRYVFELAVAAKERGHEVVVLCGGEGPLVEKLGMANIKTIIIPGFGRNMDLLRDAPRLLFIMKSVWQERPDVFHINSSKMGGAGIFSGRVLGIRNIIFTSHGWAFNEAWRPGWQKILIKFFSWLTILGAHKTICVSNQTKSGIEDWPFVRSRLVVVHNGLQEFEYLPRAQARTELGIEEEDLFHVGTIGELHKVKGHDVLLRAWQKFVRKHPSRLTIVGGGEERNNLENLAGKLGISDSVTFTGFVDNARSLDAAFDVFVFPSRSENLPYAVLEAGFASRAVIASSVGGIPEIIETGVNGVLVPKEDPELLLSSLILLHDNPRMRDRLGAELKKTVTEKFSFEKMVNETLATY